MSVTEFFRFPRVCRRMYAGPLGQYVDAFSEQLVQLGYTKRTIRAKIRVVAQFSHWLGRQGFGAADVDLARRQGFLSHRKRAGGWTSDDAAALQGIQTLLCEQGVTPVPAATDTRSEYEAVAQDFHAYLLAKRGLAVATARNYHRIAACFLQACFGDEPVQTETLSSADVIGFVQRHAHGHGPAWAQLMVTALRALLRYLHHHGRTPTDLAACVPTVAAWSLASVPGFLSPEQTQQVLEHCDRQRATGRRDYAMLLLCARLGLRAGEVAALHLGDIDWTGGGLAIRGKGGRWTHMPLPQEVGEAIADYLVQGRPVCRDRHVFVREHAPHRGFSSSSSVSAVATRALARAGIETQRLGAHLFRHTLATEMLRQGASLAEIGRVLRHQHPDTTRIYAKVDLPALHQLAPPWPGGEQ
jgi:site-specific recombinase XerD